MSLTQILNPIILKECFVAQSIQTVFRILLFLFPHIVVVANVEHILLRSNLKIVMNIIF